MAAETMVFSDLNGTSIDPAHLQAIYKLRLTLVTVHGGTKGEAGMNRTKDW